MGYSIFYWGLRGNFIKVHLGKKTAHEISLPNIVCGFSAALCKKKPPLLPCLNAGEIVWDLHEILAKWASSLAVEEGLPYV